VTTSECIRLTLLSRSAAATRGQLHLEPGKGEQPETVAIRGQGGHDYTCGKCGAVLIAHVPAPMVSNAAIRCNRCGNYSDGGRPAKWAKSPTMNHEVEGISIPQQDYPPLEPPKPCPHDGLLKDLHSQFVRQWRTAQGERPRRLYHYTTLTGLMGILRSHQLWITDAAYLNDATEVQHALSLIQSAMAERAKGASENCCELLKRSQPGANPEDAGRAYYVACMCTERDLLSQWRAYGANGGGYAIGFSACEMATEGLVALRRVVYSRQQKAELISGVLERLCSAFDRVSVGRSIAELDKEHVLPSFAQLLASHLTEFLVTFKHEAFEEEREWRIALPFARDQHIGFVQYRASAGFAVPYMQLHPRTPTPEMPLLPIVEIVHGPTLHPDLTKKSLHLFLQSVGYDHVEVSGSQTPLRA
jgi:hypothetical protein